jgi:hypothetical protein
LFVSPERDETIQFPAVTICPLSPSGLPILQNEFWMIRTFPDTDVAPAQPLVQTKYYEYRGASVPCLQYNFDSSNYNTATSSRSAMVIRFNQDLTGVTDPFLMTGAVGILHDQAADPEFQDPPMFYAPLGQTTQVSILNYYVRNTKREPTNQYFVAIPAIVSNHVSGSSQNTSQVILAYNQWGYYLQSQYHVYTAWDWIGEVGGAAALLFFLQHGILWVSIGCARRTCFRKQRKVRKDAELAAEIQKAENEENDAASSAAVQAALAEDAATNAAIAAAHASDASSTTSRRNRRRRNQTQGEEEEERDDGGDGKNNVEMTTASSSASHSSKPRNNKPKPSSSSDRLVIDMHALDESSH